MGISTGRKAPKCQELYFLVDHWNLIINRPVSPTTRLSYNQQIAKTVLNYWLQRTTKNWKANSFLHHWWNININLMQGTTCLQTTIFSTSEPWDPQWTRSHLPVPFLPVTKISALQASLPWPASRVQSVGPTRQQHQHQGLWHTAHLIKRNRHWSFKS